jgi:hypothetical protein
MLAFQVKHLPIEFASLENCRRKVAGEFLNLPHPSGRTRPWGLIQPLTEISPRNIKIIMFLGSKVRQVLRADNLTAICEPIV